MGSGEGRGMLAVLVYLSGEKRVVSLSGRESVPARPSPLP
jgi:hypothetical protein